MRSYCTLSDKNYLKQGLALIRSLRHTSTEEFEIYYLCMDDETFDAVVQYDCVFAIKLPEVESYRPEILEYKNKKPYNEYCWALASIFTRFLLEEYSVPSMMYIDADIYFYQDPLIVFNELGDRSVGIIRHRHNTASSPDGEFNVGIIYFKNDSDGIDCLRWWNDCLLHESRPDLATCGDQKYLEEFSKMYSTVAILDETFAHGAPWNYRLYVYDHFLENGTIVWGDKVQPLVFNHFSKFSLDHPTSGQYADHTLNFQVFGIPAVRHMYEQYANEVR